VLQMMTCCWNSARDCELSRCRLVLH
jgi:hypothetical protein